MAFLLKVFSGSERLKEKQRSAALVNEAFQAELKDVQTKLEVENYELQMLVEMIYDSSYPESQKFLKQPSKDRLYAHKETISSLLFGFAAQGVSVAPLILTHFQTYGCDAIADTLITLLDLVRPLLASKNAPEFTSDDILNAIDVQWHSSVRSSPAFASLRGSTAASPLQSPRVSFSNLSPRQSFSNRSPSHSFSNLSPRQNFSNRSPSHSFSNLSPGKSVSSPVSPYRLTQPSSPHSEAFLEGARAAPAPRRSLSAQYPEVNAERLQPLVEHEEEASAGNFRKQDEKDGACTREETFSAVDPVHSSSLDVEFGKGLPIDIPRSAASFEVEEFTGDQTHGEPKVEFSRDKSVGDGDAEVLISGGHGGVLGREVPPYSHDVSEKDVVPSLPTKNTSQTDDEPRLKFSCKQLDKSVGDVNAEVLSEGFSGGHDEDTADILESEAVPSFYFRNHEVSEEDILALPTKGQLHAEDSDQTVGDRSVQLEPGLEPSHEQLDKSVGDGNAEVMPEGFSGSHEDILQTEVPSGDLSHHEVSEKDNVALPTESQFHVEDSEQTAHEVNVEELNSSGNSLISKEGMEGDRAASLHDTEVEKSPQSLESKENIQKEMDKAEELFLVANTESRDKAVESVKKGGRVGFAEEDEAMEGLEKDGAMEGVKEGGEIMEGAGKDGAIMEVVEEDGFIEGVKAEDVNPLEPALMKNKEPTSEASNKEYSVENKGVGEEELQKLSAVRSIALSRTDILSQSSFSDHYDGEETTESSSGEEASSSDDETDDEETTSVKKKKNGEHRLSRSSDENQALKSQLDEEHVGNPALEGEDLASGVSSADHALGSKVPVSEQKVTLASVSFSGNETEKDYDADLVKSGTSLRNVDVPMKQESHGAELFGREYHQKNEPSHCDREGFSHSEELGGKFAGSEANQAGILGGNHSQDEGPLIDSIESEDHLEAEKGSGNVDHSAGDFHMSHNDSEVFSSAVGNKFTGSGDNEGKSSTENHAQGDEEKLADSAKREGNETNKKGAGAITRYEAHSAEDMEVMASHSQQDDEEGASSSNQYWLNLADRGEEISATNQLISTKSGEENGLKEGGSDDSFHLCSTIDEKDKNPISGQIDTEEGISSNGVRFVDKTEADDLLVHKAILPHQDEGQDFKQVLDGVSYQDIKQVLNHEEKSSQKNGTSAPTTDVHVDDSIHSSGNHEVIKEGEVPELSKHDFKRDRDSAPFLGEDDARRSLVAESGGSYKMSNGLMERDDKIWEENEMNPEVKEQPQSLEKENNVEIATGSATYGVFLHNTKFLDSQGNFVKALTAPVIMARHVETQPERHSIRDSLICTPASNSEGISRTHEYGRRRKHYFLRTWCFTCCSKPSAL